MSLLTFNDTKVDIFTLIAKYFERIFQKSLLKIENQQLSKVTFCKSKQKEIIEKLNNFKISILSTKTDNK